MAQSKELVSVEQKLLRLFQLQAIDSKIDSIRILRGELPIEVQDLEDEIEGLSMRVRKIQQEIAEQETYSNNNQNKIDHSKELLARYEQQLNNVKNNREYDALTKEIEMQTLEVDLANKRIRDAKRKIAEKDVYLNETQARVTGREQDLKLKKEELEVITKETAEQEAKFLKQSEKAASSIEERLLKAYNRVRNTYRNGLAVVSVARDACGGCFGKIPPQRQLEIKQRKKIIVCEHCARILVDSKIESPSEFF
ncbi:MAG: zinc ribbon domain-containing protein [Chitinophagales bacterium]